MVLFFQNIYSNDMNDTTRWYILFLKKISILYRAWVLIFGSEHIFSSRILALDAIVFWTSSVKKFRNSFIVFNWLSMKHLLIAAKITFSLIWNHVCLSQNNQTHENMLNECFNPLFFKYADDRKILVIHHFYIVISWRKKVEISFKLNCLQKGSFLKRICKG